MFLGRRLSLQKATPLGGGLVAQLIVSQMYGGTRFSVELNLRTRGAGDLELSIPAAWRESPKKAAEYAEEVLTHFASALRQAGAT